MKTWLVVAKYPNLRLKAQFIIVLFSVVAIVNMLQGDGPFGPVVNGTMVVFYQYRPNQVAGYTFMALFSLATLGHIVYIVRLKTWIFIPFILGGIGEQTSNRGQRTSLQHRSNNVQLNSLDTTAELYLTTIPTELVPGSSKTCSSSSVHHSSQQPSTCPSAAS